MVVKVTYEEIYPIWKNYLWPNRTSTIEPNSAMCYLGGYDMFNMSTEPTFFAYMIDDKIAGVNSGHSCSNQHYRSRGLFVFDEYRKRGIGTQLLLATIEQAKTEGATMCWSYPRQDSWKTYEKAGFVLQSEFKQDESGLNAYCNIVL